MIFSKKQRKSLVPYAAAAFMIFAPAMTVGAVAGTCYSSSEGNEAEEDHQLAADGAAIAKDKEKNADSTVSKGEISAMQEENSRVVIANCSAYTASPEECGDNSSGITASGTIAQEGVTVAMDDVPLGTRVRINGHEYIVEDRFGGGYENRVDIFFDSKEDALRFGRQNLEVEILG